MILINLHKAKLFLFFPLSYLYLHEKPASIQQRNKKQKEEIQPKKCNAYQDAFVKKVVEKLKYKN